MQSKSTLYIVIALVLIIGFVFFSNSSENSTSVENAQVQTNTSAETTQKTEVDSDSTLTGAGSYLAYSPTAVSSSNAEHIVLNFSATWCPSCRTVDKDINANLSSIPTGTEIYKVDYDTSLELRKKYGVTTQHTFVLIDKDGNQIKKWIGGNSLQSVLARI